MKQKENQKRILKEKSLLGMKKKIADMEEVPKGFEGEFANNSGEESEGDDDEEWYRQEVGQAPDKDLFDGQKYKSKSGGKNFDPRFKKRKHPGDKKAEHQFKRQKLNQSDAKGRGAQFKNGGKFKKPGKPSFKTKASQRGDKIQVI